MPRYFDTANPTFRFQALAILMLLLLAGAILAACGAMAYRHRLQGPWYKNMLPFGAKPAPWTPAGILPGRAETYSWHRKSSMHKLHMAFVQIGRAAVIDAHSNLQSTPLMTRLFPKDKGWLAPHDLMRRVQGVPMLFWQSLRRPIGVPSTHPAGAVAAFRYVVMRATDDNRLDVFMFGADHAPGRFDNLVFLQLVARMAVADQ